MNKIISTIVIILSLFAGRAPCRAFEAMNDVSGFKAKVKELSKVVSTIQSDFVQEKNLSFLSEKIISNGKFFFKAKNQLRWEYTDPYQYLIIINGDNIIIKDDEEVNRFDAKSNKMFKEINSMMLGAIQGNILNDNDKFGYDFREDDKLYFVRLTPLDEKRREIIKSIEIYFDKKTFSVRRFKIIEAGDDYTLIDFVNEKLNDEISDEKFNIN